MEGHRVAEVSWSKFSREISVELALEPKMRKPAFDFLTICRAEYDRLINIATTSKLHILRDVIMFAYMTGARWSEIMKLLRTDVSFDKQTATFRDTKNGTDRTIPLSDEVVSILKRYPFGDTFFRVSSYDSFKFYFKQACRKADIDDFRFHDLRACFCTNALLSGMSEASVAAISGHKDYRSMKRYTRIKAQDLIEDVNNITAIKENKNR